MTKWISSKEEGVTKTGERNDCVVRAISNATGRNYDDVHALLKKHGREDCRGTFWGTTASVMEELKFDGVAFNPSCNAARFMHKQTGIHLERKGITLGKLVKELPRGRFVVYIRGHALALVNGEIIDTGMNKASARVNAIWFDPETAFK